MKSRTIFASLSVCLVLAVSGLIAAENDAAKEGEQEFKATCPVANKPAIESSFVELPENGGKVYFCCKNCPKRFAADPAKYETKVRRQLAETGQIVQVGCPISGRPVNEETLVDVGQTKVGFCCKNCLAKFNAASDDDKLAIVFGDLDKGFTRQTKCPVSGKPINAKHTAEYQGKKVYFCCEHCPAAFEANPEKFVAKLPQFAKTE